MPFVTPQVQEIEASMLREVSNANPDARISDDSDYLVRAAGVASAAEGLYEHQSWIVRQIFPDSADIDMLERHCTTRDIYRKKAVPAAGTVQVTGQPGFAVPSGLVMLHADGRTYLTTAPINLDAEGAGAITVAATTAGHAGNVAAGVALTLQSPPLGVDGSAKANAIVGGTDIETPEALLARLLEYLRHPPAGGNKYDFKRWALEVPGVTDAYVYPLRRGLGTCDVVITANGDLPSPEVVIAAQTHLDIVRNVTARGALAIAPTKRLIPQEIKIQPVDGMLFDDVKPLVLNAIDRYFAGLLPGDMYIRSRLESVISTVPGVKDRLIVIPAANVLALVNASVVEWLRKGDVQVTAL